MNGIEDLKLMLESRSTDYGKMRQILSMYLLNNDKVVSDLCSKLKVAEDALEKSPCGEVYQLGLVDDDGNCYNGIAVKFDEEEGNKLPRVGCGDKFVVVPYSALAAIREEGGEK